MPPRSLVHEKQKSPMETRSEHVSGLSAYVAVCTVVRGAKPTVEVDLYVKNVCSGGWSTYQMDRTSWALLFAYPLHLLAISRPTSLILSAPLPG